ncbi:MAG TPA: DUF2066 domain-containing protein [Steroidobacteraceae bacterium]|jgi:hypothetical protein|nr:DUF2066 domain-containing protein [Steroidobacteraceae bacterium]
MHRARGIFLTGLLLAATLAMVMPVARGVPMPSLYVVIVPGSDLTQAAQEAMRVELVKLTGTRAAASDPSLASLIDNVRQYVQLERATTTGQIQVLFNESALTAALAAAGRTVWDADRPLLWVVLPRQAPASAEALRLRLAAAADARGLPITVVTALASGQIAPGQVAPGQAAPAVATAAAPASAAAAAAPAAPVNVQQALDTALRAGASAVLVAQGSPADPGMLQWTLTAPNTSGQWSGGPELAIDQATDALASATRTLDQAPVAQYDCHITGVNDLASLVNVLSAVEASPGVSQVAVSDVHGDELTLHLDARGSGAQLERMLASGRLQPAGPGTGGELQYRYVAGP